MLELAPEANDLGIVLVPSIALISQVRREYLGYLNSIGRTARVLAVCSDKTAGHVEEKNLAKGNPDPTHDVGQVTTADVDCEVAQCPADVAEWLAVKSDKLRVIFSTYQSAHHTAEALKQRKQYAQVLVMDEAHRTAQLRPVRGKARTERLRRFTLCHNQLEFPARYRLYQTATPRVYDEGDKRRINKRTQKYVANSMDDVSVFGPVAYRLSYIKALKDGLLSDYKILAIGVHSHGWDEARRQIMKMQNESAGKGVTQLEVVSWLVFGTVLAGAVRGINDDGHSDRPVARSLAFLNQVKRSQQMAEWLSSDEGRAAVERYMSHSGFSGPAPHYVIDHLDAGHRVDDRRRALRNLRAGTVNSPRSISNVGIFGEGVDSPNLDAVALLASRRSPVEIIQIVGRVMRRSPDKTLGYVLVPVPLPRGLDAETSLSLGTLGEEWKALGETLRALRAHDGRIEDEISHLLSIHVPPDPQPQRGHVVILQPTPNSDVIAGIWTGPAGGVEGAVATASVPAWSQGSPPAHDYLTQKNGFRWLSLPDDDIGSAKRAPSAGRAQIQKALSAFPAVLVLQRRRDGLHCETHQPAFSPDGTPDVSETVANARRVALQPAPLARRPRRRKRPHRKHPNFDGFREPLSIYMASDGTRRDYRVEVMEKSGLRGNSERDFNLLLEPVTRISAHLRAENLEARLRAVLAMDHMRDADTHADACKVSSLILLNATLLHSRLEDAGGAVASLVHSGRLEDVQRVANPAAALRAAWNAVLEHDYDPIFRPALDVLNALDRADAAGGVYRALRELAAWASQNAESYASMGMEYAGELFSRVLGHQASDGAYFTRPSAARLLAELTLDATGETDWNNRATWDRLRMVDLACGSGTLLNAYLETIKDRIRDQGGPENDVQLFHKYAVENLIAGLDINPVSLQLAAGRLTLGNLDVNYRRMNLHAMPFGPQRDGQSCLGSLELFTDGRVLTPKANVTSPLFLSEIHRSPLAAPVLDAVSNRRAVVMNPPFSSNIKRGAKFWPDHKDAMQDRELRLRDWIACHDPEAGESFDVNTISTMFTALGDTVLKRDDSILAMVMAVTACTGASVNELRRLIGMRFHVKMIVCCHDPRQPNMSSHTSINECLIINSRGGGNDPTRFINLRQFPRTTEEARDIAHMIRTGRADVIGTECLWPVDRMRRGDWSPVQWFNPVLAESVYEMRDAPGLCTLKDTYETGPVGRRIYDAFARLADGAASKVGDVDIFDSTSSAQRDTLSSSPDTIWRPKRGKESLVRKYLGERGWVMLASRARTNVAIVSAVCHPEKHLGGGFVPVLTGSLDEAKAVCVVWNSSPVLLQLLSLRSKTLQYVNWSVAQLESVRLPANLREPEVQARLVELYDRLGTTRMKPWAEADTDPVRAEIDRAAADLFGIPEERVAEWRGLLVREPSIANRVVD